MKILVVSATEKEILLLKNRLDINLSGVCTLKYTAIKDFSVDFLVTGIGSVFTVYKLLKRLSVKKYDLVINAGIAGSFNRKFQMGDVVYVHEDQFADLGIEEKNGLKTLFEKGFIKNNEYPFKNSKLINESRNELKLKIDEEIKDAKSITVNTTHGINASIEMFKEKYNADIETMEGAAVFYVCFQEGLHCIQIRSVSNYVEERNDSRWNIPLAIENLNNKLFEIINEIKHGS